MIRDSTPDDQPALLDIAVASGLFEPAELDALRGMLRNHFAPGASPGQWLTDDDEHAGPVGVAYVEPERMTQGTYNLLLLAAHPGRQRQGRGRAIVEHVEGLLRLGDGRLLLVETLGTDEFDGVRAFYRRAGFAEEARVRDYYAAGMDKVIYRKSLAAQ